MIRNKMMCLQCSVQFLLHCNDSQICVFQGLWLFNPFISLYCMSEVIKDLCLITMCMLLNVCLYHSVKALSYAQDSLTCISCGCCKLHMPESTLTIFLSSFFFLPMFFPPCFLSLGIVPYTLSCTSQTPWLHAWCTLLSDCPHSMQPVYLPLSALFCVC